MRTGETSVRCLRIISFLGLFVDGRQRLERKSKRPFLGSLAPPDQNVLLPHDVLRILIQLLAWGDLETAKQVLPGHKKRLYTNIQERLDYEKSEIELRHKEEMAKRETMEKISPLFHPKVRWKSECIGCHRGLHRTSTRGEGVV